MKKRLLSLVIGILSIGTLVGCGDGETAYVENITEGTYRGVVEGLRDSYNSGDTVTFTVKPIKNFDIDKVTFNGNEIEWSHHDQETNKYTYSVTAAAGNNKLGTYFKIDKDADLVSQFKMNIDSKVFEYVTSFSESTKASPGSLDNLDFRRDGIEQFRAPIRYDSATDKFIGKADTKVDGETFFFNCVDGDTTHMESFNLKYTVKIRYLMVDTQESTSQMEPWGLSGSYFSKYVFWGDQGKENHVDAHYEQKMNALFTASQLQKLTGGATHIILMSQEFANHASEVTKEELLESKGKDPEYKGKYGSITDGNLRDLAVVWYAKSKNAKPTIDEYRCLNLELVYQGFSKNAATLAKNGAYYYNMFDSAALSAEANERALWSSKKDPYFYYYDNPSLYPVKTMKLSDLYKSGSSHDVIGYYPDSSYCDKMRFWAVEGYITRKVKEAFYLQDRPSYTGEELEKIMAGDKDREVGYGIYVFTYANTPFDVGMHVRVVGAFSSYGGSYQMQGIQYTENHPNLNRDTTILDVNPDGTPVVHEIKPIQLTVAQFHQLQLPTLLVEITENVYFNDFITTYEDPKTGEVSNDPACLGGSREINTMSSKYYQFYYTNNQITLFARYGAIDDSEEVKETQHDGDVIRTSNDFLRVLVNQEINISYRAEKESSYKFFTGGTNYYHKDGPKYIDYDPETGEPLNGTVKDVFSRKIINYTKFNLGLVGISNGYISTSGSTMKMQISVVNGADIYLPLDKAPTVNA